MVRNSWKDWNVSCGKAFRSNRGRIRPRSGSHLVFAAARREQNREPELTDPLYTRAFGRFSPHGLKCGGCSPNRFPRPGPDSLPRTRGTGAVE